MATLLSQTYILPTIEAVRATAAGTKYTVKIPGWRNIVTVTDAQMTCTCQHSDCCHIQAVQLRRAHNAADARRMAYEAAFDLSYGDLA